MTDAELPQLVGTLATMPQHHQEAVQSYARACVAHATAAKDAEIERLRAERDALRKECDLLTHQIITCGVAAHSQDPNLSRTGAYAMEWNSAQAEMVRKLRDRADRTSAKVDDLAALVTKLAYSLDKPSGNTLLARQAMDYLRRQGLAGSPMREGES